MTCPIGTYNELETRTCRKCDVICNQCTGPTTSDCSVCSKGLPFRFKGFCFSGRCPYGTQQMEGSTSLNEIVCGCDESCATCEFDEANSRVNCLSCTNKEYTVANDKSKCVKTTECDVKTFADFSSGTGVCKNSCPTETDPSNLRIYNSVEKKCTDYCRTNSLVFNLYCVSQCPDGFYNKSSSVSLLPSDRTLFECAPCSLPCLTCSSPTSCLSCQPGNFFHEYTNLCLPSCADGYTAGSYNICRICRSGCEKCPPGLVRSHTYKCVQKCLPGTIENNGICISSGQTLLWIANKTQDGFHLVSMKKDLILMANFSVDNGASAFDWGLSGVSAIYANNFFAKTVKNLQVLQIPKGNLLSNASYNVSVRMNGAEAYILIRTEDFFPGYFMIKPLKGYSGVDNFIMTLNLWNFTTGLKIDLYSYLQITVVMKNSTEYSMFNPSLIFKDISFNGEFSFQVEPLKTSKNQTFEIVARTALREIRQNITLEILAYPGNLTSWKESLWLGGELNSIESISETVNKIKVLYGTDLKFEVSRETLKNIYKAYQLLSNMEKFYCDDLTHCSGNGVCGVNELEETYFSCKCFKGFSGETCAWKTNELIFSTNKTMTAIVYLQQYDIVEINSFKVLSIMNDLLTLGEIVPFNGILILIMLTKKIVETISELSYESLILILDCISELMDSLFYRPVFYEEERMKYGPILLSLSESVISRIEDQMTLGQTLFISTTFLDLYLEKKTKADILMNNLYSNSSIVVPLTKIQLSIPFSNIKKDGIITIKVVQWICEISRPSKIVFTPIIEVKSGGEKIEEFASANLIYLGKIANYNTLKGKDDIYSCQVYDQNTRNYYDVNNIIILYLFLILRCYFLF